MSCIASCCGIKTFDTDSGSANPAQELLLIFGGSNINTSAVNSTITISLNNTISVSGSITAAGYVRGSYYRLGASLWSHATGNEGGGMEASTGLTNVTNSIQSSGEMVIKSTTTHPGTNSGYIKMYIDRHVVYIPYFEDIAP